MPMRTSPLGIVALRGREGCKLKAYRDSVGVWTIGVGHTGRTTGDKVTEGMTITQAQADAFLAADLAPVEKVVNSYNLDLTQNEFDALVSWLFNVGEHAFATSTVLKRLKAGDKPGAAVALLMWNKPSEIIGRRKTERAQFLTPYAAAAPAYHDAPAAPEKPVVTQEVPPKLPFFASLGLHWPF